MNERDMLRAQLVATIVGGLVSARDVGDDSSPKHIAEGFRIADAIIARIDLERGRESERQLVAWLGQKAPPLSCTESGP